MSKSVATTRDSTLAVLDAVLEFGDGFCQMLGPSGIDPALAVMRRDRLVPELMRMGRLRDALSHGPSIGLYGESQCGKSFLVSRMASHLGAKETPEGSLLLDGAMDGRSHGVEFKTHVNPEAAQEATGVVCRFSMSGVDSRAPNGTWILEMASVEDVLAMIAIGFDVSHRGGEVGRRREMVRATIAKFRRSGVGHTEAAMEEDDGSVFEAVVPRLAQVWQRLRSGAIRIDTSRVDDLDNGDDGWDELVLEMLRRKQRPRIDFDSPDSGFDELVSLLWEQESTCTTLWRHLFRALWDLGFPTRVAVRIADACKKSGAPQQDSLADIALLRESLPAEIGPGRGTKVEVQPLDGRRSGEWLPIGRATLAALGTVLNLPLIASDDASGPAPGVPRIDVLDFPGARSLHYDRVARYSGMEEFLQSGFIRGKVAYLFDAAVDRFEATVLCLSVKAKGNEEAAGVGESIRIWLEREGWCERPRQVDAELPPLVMAVTRADELFLDFVKNPNTSHSVLQGRLDQIGGRYSLESADWWERWSGEGGRFDRVHWVHDPSANLAEGFRQTVEARHAAGQLDPLRRLLTEQWSTGKVSNHTRKDLLEAVVPIPWSHADYLEERRQGVPSSFQGAPATEDRSGSDGRPRDIDLLFERISLVAAPAIAARDRRVLERAVEPCRALLGSVLEVYRGPGDESRAELVRQEALEHVDLVERVLAKHHTVVAEILEVFSLPPEAVRRAFRRAREEDRFRTGDGEERFAILHGHLLEVLGNILSKAGVAGSRPGRWLWRRMVPREQQSEFAALLERLERVAHLPWFADELKRGVLSVLEEEDPAAISEHALSEVVATIWSRTFVWFGELPKRRFRPEHLPPRLRRRSEASGRILEGWRRSLPDLYVRMEDPKGRSSELNTRLERLFRPLRDALDRFEDSDEEPIATIRKLFTEHRIATTEKTG